MLDSVLQAFHWRLAGPYRGGRAMAVAGHPRRPQVFYFGSTGGGIWQTDDGGAAWRNISDGFFRRGSVGALALAEADPSVIYVGMGECGMRADQTHGDGVYVSRDGGQSWTHHGLAETHNIARVRVHPRDPDLVYLAAFGHRFGPNPERGVYRSRDGGRTWDQVLFRGERAGAIDLAMDPDNPRVLYAALWQGQIFPWGRQDRGPGSGLFKTTDGGDTWTELTRNPGLPAGELGKIGVAVSPVRPGRVYALIDAEQGGMYRSDDGGQTWTWLNADRNFLVRPWYFMHLTADPQDADGIYVVNRKLWHSADGGRTYRQVDVPYVDQHDLWIDPRDPDRMILGNDGGVAVSFNGGRSWSPLVNQPTAEIYRAAADNHFPYRIYGSQQDNSTLCLPSRTELGPISQMQWYDVGGGESGFIAVRPDNPDIVYSSDLPGLGITRYDHRTKQIQEISPWLDRDGLAGDSLRYRFNWSVPVVISPHDPNVLYVLGNFVFRSTTEGKRWDIISPDLTRSDPDKLGGVSSTGERGTVNDYATLCSFAESPVERGVLWAASDDGLVHVSRDDGGSWSRVTPPGLPAWSTVQVEASAHDPGRAYVSATAHALDDFRPYVFKTTDYGQTWEAIPAGIPEDEFVRVVREDPARRGLLYAGTEAGVHVSLDDGAAWHPLQLNLPRSPVHDLVVKDGDLIAATHGRSMWILDDLTPLHQLSGATLEAPVHVFAPRPVYRLTRQVYGLDSLLALYHPFAAPNPPAGVVVYYHLAQAPEAEVSLSLLDSAGRTVSTYSSRAPEARRAPIGPMAYHLSGGAAVLTAKPEAEAEPGVKWGPLTLPPPEPEVVPARAGLNRFVLDLRYPGAPGVPGAQSAGLTEPLAPPGQYRVRLKIGDSEWTVPVEVRKDPRVSASQQDLEAQFALMVQIRDRTAEVHAGVRLIRDLVGQIQARLDALPDGAANQPIRAAAADLLQKLADVEARLIQPGLTPQSGELDSVHFRPRLNAKLGALGYAVARSDDAPTQAAYDLFADLSARAAERLARLQSLLDHELAALNGLVKAADVPAISVRRETKADST